MFLMLLEQSLSPFFKGVVKGEREISIRNKEGHFKVLFKVAKIQSNIRTMCILEINFNSMKM